MPVNSKHPKYAAMLTAWQAMRVSYAGEEAVKAEGFTYLPATAGMIIDGAGKPGAKGHTLYESYKHRAVFPDYISDAVEMYIGLLHQKPPTIELPKAMEALLEKASSTGESLQVLLRRINEQQLVTGRLGLMLDLPKEAAADQPLPFLALYTAENIINWDDSNDGNGINSLNLVVLDESCDKRSSQFDWERVEQYRVLQLGGGATAPEASTPADGEAVPTEAAPATGNGVYHQGVVDVRQGSTGGPSELIAPMYRGKTLDRLPFVFINSKDIVADPDNPPLLGLMRLCMAIYRGEADYRQNLHMQGQDTLVVIGGTREDGDLRVGAGARIDVDSEGDAKFIGASSDGLQEQRESVEADRKRAEAKAGTLVSPQAGKQESGEALTTRLAAQTASLIQIAETGAAGLQEALRIAAKWMGLDPETVKVTANTEFSPVVMTGQEISQLMGARTMGAPLSLKSLHGVFVNRGMTTMTYEEELEQIEEEDLDRADRLAGLPQPPAPPAPAPAPGQPGAKPGAPAAKKPAAKA